MVTMIEHNYIPVKEMPKCGFGFVTWLRCPWCPWWPAPCPGIRDAGSASRGTSGEATLCAKFGNFQNFARTFLQPIASPEPWMIHRSHNLDFYLISLGEAFKFSPLWNSADKKILIRFGNNFSIFGLRSLPNSHFFCNASRIPPLPLFFSQRLCNLWKGGQLKARQGAGEWVMRGRLASGSWTIPPNWKAIGGTLLANYIADKTWHLSETTLLWKFTARPFAWQPIVKESRGNRSDSTRFSKTS